MKKNQKNQTQALDDSNLENVSGGITQEGIKRMYDAGYRLQVSQNYGPAAQAPGKADYRWIRYNYDGDAFSGSFNFEEGSKLAEFLEQNP